jgi:glycosyltransferase involved in cell wall biosynthesis
MGSTMALRLPADRPPEAPDDSRSGREPRIEPSATVDVGGDVVLFLPAFDEQDAISDVIARVPSSVCGRRVRCLVIDDGSRDATAERARAAGVEVVALGTNRGLGAAVRIGLREGLARGASVVAFCDADGEYAPEELESVVAPILAGTADYVVGTRFGDGRPCHMRSHRCLGNRLLTRWLAFTARQPITDGQSGYRALSARAAEVAEVAHDYNYAQVLTLDLLARGFRYAEVPISYRFRTTGTSFVRLVPYLRAVVPAVYRVVNRQVRDPQTAGAGALVARSSP